MSRHCDLYHNYLKRKPGNYPFYIISGRYVARNLKGYIPPYRFLGILLVIPKAKRYSELSLLSQLKLFTARCKDRLSSRMIDYFICNSKAINIKALGIPGDKIKIIYRGRHFRNYSYSPEEVNSLRKEFGPENQTLFPDVGRLIKSKGLLDIVQSFKINLKKYPERVLLIAGEGALRCNPETRIKNIELEKNVFRFSYREDVPSLWLSQIILFFLLISKGCSVLS